MCSHRVEQSCAYSRDLSHCVLIMDAIGHSKYNVQELHCVFRIVCDMVPSVHTYIALYVAIEYKWLLT